MQALIKKIRAFAQDRDWEQFHSPKNLAMALSVEVAEVVEHFQWLTQEESKSLPPEKHEEVEHELADILIYLLRLAQKLNVDLFAAAHRKMDLNEEKYPSAIVRGSAKKYTEYAK